MPIVTQVTPQAGNEDARTLGALIFRIARLIGGDTSDRVTDMARISLQDAVVTADALRHWQDRYLEQDVPLALTTATYPLPTRFRHPAGCAWLKTAANVRTLRVVYRPRQYFLASLGNTGGATGLPWLYTVQNRVVTGQLEVWAPPSAANLANYPTLMIPYYASIIMPQHDEDVLGVGEVLEQAILEEARANFYLYVTDAAQEARQRQRAAVRWQQAVADDNERRMRAATYGSPWRGV